MCIVTTPSLSCLPWDASLKRSNLIVSAYPLYAALIKAKEQASTDHLYSTMWDKKKDEYAVIIKRKFVVNFKIMMMMTTTTTEKRK